MSVYQDIDSAISVMKGNDKIRNHYNKINIFPNYSLKHFKKYKLEDRKVLTYINNMCEVFDLLSYGANVTCFSSNRLDKYFLNLLLKLYETDISKYQNFILNDYKNNNILNSGTYESIKERLDEETLIFFDELYSYCKKRNIEISNLISNQKYPKQTLERYIRTFIKKRYNEVRNNEKVSYWNLGLNEAYTTFKPNTFSFINLSLDLEHIEEEKLNKLILLEEKYLDLLKDNGKIQGFQSRKIIQVPNHKIIETRSIKDPNTKDSSCEKDYAYVYSK